MYLSVYLSEVKGPVMDQLVQAGFVDHWGGPERVFLSTHQAMQTLGQVPA
ncbi:MAG: hypothetical protein ACHWZW_21235 [Spirulina sp.]